MRLKMGIGDKSLQRLILKYVFTCFGIAVLTVCLLVPVFKTAYENTRKMKFQDYSTQISKGFYSVSSDLYNIQSNVLYHLKGNPDILNLALETGTQISANQYLLNLKGYLSSVNLANHTILGMIVSFQKNDFILTHDRIYDNSNTFYPYFFHYESMDRTAWHDRLFQSKEIYWPGETVQFLNENPVEALTINGYYPTVSAPSVAYSILIDNSYIEEQLLIPQIEESAFFYLVKDQDKVLVSYRYDEKPLKEPVSQNEITVNGVCYTLIVLQDSISGLTLVFGIQSEAFTSDLTAMLMGFSVNILWALAAALLFSVGYAYLSHSPLKSVLNQLHLMNGDKESHDETEGVYQYIQTALDNISKQAGTLQDEYDDLRKGSEKVVFDLMLHGNVVKDQVLQSVFEQRGVFRGGYVLVLVQGDNLKALTTDRDDKLQGHFLSQFLIERFRNIFENIYIHQSSGLCVVINVAGNGGIERIMEEISRMLRILHATLPEEQVRVAISGIHNDLSSLSVAYSQAGYCLQWLRMQQTEKIGQFDALPQKPETIPFSKFENLHQMLRAGDTQGVSDFFETIYFNSGYAVNSRQTEDIFHMISMIFYSVQTNLLKGSQLTIYPYDPDVSPINLIRMQKETALSICELINQKKRSHNLKLKEDILEFIQKNYSCPDLSLTMIADHFRISNRYASQFIKEQTGINYTAHLENLRMTAAAQLLSDTNTPISDVAQKTGFESKNTFYKAFMRKFNMSPSAYREYRHQEERIHRDAGQE